MHELLVVNPLKRRRARKSNPRRGRSAAQRAATARMLAANRRNNPVKRHRRRARRAANPVTVSRVRRYARRHLSRRRSNPISHRRRRRNPIGLGMLRMSGVVGMVKSAAIGGAGALGMDFLWSKITGYLPTSLQSDAGKAVDINDALKIFATVIAGRALSRPTKGLSMKMAEGSLTVQMFTLISNLATMYAPSLVNGVGYANPARTVPGNGRISPITRGRVGMFAPGFQSPALSAFAPGATSPLLAGVAYGSRRR